MVLFTGVLSGYSYGTGMCLLHIEKNAAGWGCMCSLLGGSPQDGTEKIEAQPRNQSNKKKAQSAYLRWYKLMLILLIVLAQGRGSVAVMNCS